MMTLNSLGDAGKTVVIEKYLEGEEVSVMFLPCMTYKKKKIKIKKIPPILILSSTDFSFL